MGEMTAEERDELRAALEAAGCPELAHRLKWSDFGDFSGAELRSLLRREDRLRVMEAAVRAANRLLLLKIRDPIQVYQTANWRPLHDADVDAGLAAMTLLETEVPDGQG